ICEPLKFSLMLILACACWYLLAMAVNDSLSEAAAKTFRVRVEGLGVAEVLVVPPQALRNKVQSVTSNNRERRAYLIVYPCLQIDTPKMNTHILSIEAREGISQDEVLSGRGFRSFYLSNCSCTFLIALLITWTCYYMCIAAYTRR